MNTVSKILFPAQMCPELAQVVAEKLNWAPNTSPSVTYMALTLMYASWNAEGPSSLEDLQHRITMMVAAGGTNLLATMSDEDFYHVQAQKCELGALAPVHAKQASALWASQLKKENIAKLQLQADAILSAAILDQSASSSNLAEEIEDVIEQLSDMGDTPAAPQTGRTGIMLVHPVTGQHFGPFSSQAELMSFISKQVQTRMEQVGATDKQETAEEAETPAAPGSSMAVFNPQDVQNFLKRLPPPMPNEGNAQQRRVLDMMSNDKGLRRVTMVPTGNPLAEMYERFPHFKEVLDFISKRFALAACGSQGQPAWLPPMLLRGDPGTGKTFFAEELARILGAHFESRDLNTTSEAFVISGMDSSWKNSKAGIVFDALVNGKTANPLICINEVEKAASRGGHNSPLEALYTLLEPASARNFKDEFVPIPLDTSRVMWVLTANAGELPDPIMTRVEEFNIPMPTLEECKLIAQSVWKNICTYTMPQGHPFETVLSDEVRDQVARLSPRLMRKALEGSASAAAFSGRTHLLPEDVLVAQKRYEAPKPRTIGFIPAAQA